MPEIKKKYLLLPSHKNKKKDIKNMTHDFSLSKLGQSFENNGNSFHADQLNFTKKLDGIQDNLDEVILKINSQLKRQHLLKNLVYLMKTESSKIQSEQKKSDLILKQSYNKRIQKLQYDIDQIEQKCNQQIACIAFLKQEVNCKRSERVVFSNIFKTIEHQLKKTSEKYREEIIKSQIKNKSFASHTKPYSMSKKQIIGKIQERDGSSKRASSVSIQHLQKKSILLKSNLSKKLLFSNHKEKNSLKKSSKNFKDSRFITEVSLVQQSRLEVQENNTLRKNKQIENYRSQIDKIKLHLGEQTYSYIMNFGVNMQEENKELQQKILNLDSQIQTYEYEEKEFIKMKKNNEIVQISKLPCLRRGRGRDKTELQPQTSQEPNFCERSNQQQLLQIANIFISEPNLRINQTLMEIDKAMDSLNIGANINLTNFRTRTEMRKTDSSCSKTINYNGPQDIIQRMEKITEFQKLLDENSFFLQYKKQIAKIHSHIRCSKK